MYTHMSHDMKSDLIRMVQGYMSHDMKSDLIHMCTQCRDTCHMT